MKDYKKTAFAVFVLFFFIHVPATLHLMAQNLSVSGYSVDVQSQVTVTIKDGKISKIRKVSAAQTDGEKIYLAPGLIDTQINGYAAVSFNKEGLTAEAIQKITEALWKEGITTFFPTIITNPGDLIRANLAVLKEVTQDPVLAHVMPGYFLEGPYLSPEDGFRGVHQKEWIRPPDWEEFMSFYEVSGENIIQVGLAPEQEGALDFISKCNDKGIVVSLAHHNGDAATIEQAVQRGARVSTHLGNGCANMIHRHNNPLWPQLAADKITPTIIADGHHLRKEELQVFFKVKGADNLMLVSDATELAGMPPGEYAWNGKTVVMTEDGMLQYPEQNVLAGASFPIRTGVGNMIRLTGCTLQEAMMMATQTPAKVYNLNDRGMLQEGLSADLILFSLKGGEMVIHETIVQGKTVYEKNP